MYSKILICFYYDDEVFSPIDNILRLKVGLDIVKYQKNIEQK